MWPFKKKAPQSNVNRAKEMLAESWEAYKLARRDRPRENYQPHGFSGDAAIIGSHDLMHRRTRDLVRNTAQAKRLKRVLTNLVVGNGMQTFSWPFLPSEMLEIVTELETIESGSLGPRLTFALESDDLYEQYSCEKDQFDAENRLSGPEMFRMLLGEAATVGNGLMVRVFRPEYDPDRHLVPLAWQLFEREQLDQSLDRPAENGNNRIVGGLEINARNQVVAYYLFLDHPHDFFGISQSSLQGAGAPRPSGSSKSVRVAAERVIDLALYDRPSSSLGVSWMDASGQSIWDRDSYFENELRSAAIDAVFAFAAYLDGGEKYGAWGFADSGEDDDDHGNREFKVGHSPVAATLGKDEKLEMVRAVRPNKDAGAFMKLCDRDIAAASDVSYYSLTGDYESTNFTSTRAAKMDEDQNISPIQQWFGCTVAAPIRRQFNALAGAQGLFTSVSPSEFRKNLTRYQRFDVVGQGRDLLDPFKEGEARTARLRTGISTFKEECAKRNQHWIRVLMQQAIEKRVFELFDVEPDFTKAGNGKAEAQAAPQESDEEDEEPVDNE